MRTLRFFLQKEFRQIFRDPSIIRIIFVLPVIQLMILPWAADYEIKDLHISIIDHDHSTYSQQLISKITATKYFLLNQYTDSYYKAEKAMESGQVDIAIEIPADFEYEGGVGIGNDNVLIVLSKGKPSPKTVGHISFHLPNMVALKKALAHLQKHKVELEDPGDEIGPVAEGSKSLGIWFSDPDGYRWELAVQSKK